VLYLGVIGGQGFLLGRGNQQLSYEVISKIGVGNIYVLANSGKINQIVPSRLYVDFGDAVHFKIFSDYIKVHVAIDRTLVCKVLSSGVQSNQ
jgi:predicted polyphosphate/ATP-dependent NAD kinase